MMRIAFAALGLAMAMVPDAILERYEGIALANPDDARAEPWLVQAIRAEGALYALAALAGGKAYAWLLNLAGVAGAFALAFPRRYLEVGGSIAYENSEELEWEDGFATGVRILGAVLVVLALLGIRSRRSDDTGTDEASTDETADGD